MAATRTTAATTGRDGQAAREFGVRSPLDEAELTKDEIRELSRRAGLPTWDEPASACLSSRIPYHSEVTDREAAHDRGGGVRAARAWASASAGCAITTRSRVSRLARDEMPRALEPALRDRIVAALRAIGYQHVTIDLQGYRMGSLNEGVRLRPA